VHAARHVDSTAADMILPPKVTAARGLPGYATWERPLPRLSSLVRDEDGNEQASAAVVVAEQGAAVAGQAVVAEQGAAVERAVVAEMGAVMKGDAADVGEAKTTEATEEHTAQVEVRLMAGCKNEAEVRVMMTVTAGQAKLPTITEHVMLSPQAPSPDAAADPMESSAGNSAAVLATEESSAAVSRAPSHSSVSRALSSSHVLSPCDSLDWSTTLQRSP
jgi:hypothetical protein